MIIAWIVGLLLSAIMIYVYFGTEVYLEKRSVLSRLGLITMIVFALIPIANLLAVIVEFFVWMSQMCDEDWDYTRKPGKFLKWLNERV